MGDCALITSVYLEIALLSGARSGAQATGQVISAIDIADISIRTLREEGDYPQRSVGGVHRDFYPRPPRGGRHRLFVDESHFYKFLSTPSARRATHEPDELPGGFFISIHALREEGDFRLFIQKPRQFLISIHALRGEDDFQPLRFVEPTGYFYPRPPRGGRRAAGSKGGHGHCISIHALREEGDAMMPGKARPRLDFYPRPPRGGRRVYPQCRAPQRDISIHALREEGDESPAQTSSYRPISIHALREEGDAQTVYPSRRSANFYPRPPRGGRPT